MEFVHVAFPNLDYDKISINFVKEIGDSVFFGRGCLLSNIKK